MGPTSITSKGDSLVLPKVGDSMELLDETHVCCGRGRRSNEHMTYKDHVTAMAKAFVDLDAAVADRREEVREKVLVPTLKAFYDFNDREVGREIDALRSPRAMQPSDG
jgi:hypothetical protein